VVIVISPYLISSGAFATPDHGEERAASDPGDESYDRPVSAFRAIYEADPQSLMRHRVADNTAASDRCWAEIRARRSCGDWDYSFYCPRFRAYRIMRFPEWSLSDKCAAMPAGKTQDLI
jgi:hypothetical protein